MMLTTIASMSTAFAAVVPSINVIEQQQGLYNKQQILTLIDSSEMQQKLVSLGVDPANAKSRIANMTNQELSQFNTQLSDMPAGAGVVGVIVTVLVVLAVLDVVGITDVYSFIRPIN
jgi:hypothetical protein